MTASLKAFLFWYWQGVQYTYTPLVESYVCVAMYDSGINDNTDRQNVPPIDVSADPSGLYFQIDLTSILRACNLACLGMLTVNTSSRISTAGNQSVTSSGSLSFVTTGFNRPSSS
jgi:hypothetical protein